MCIANEDIQEGWVPKPGHLYVPKEDSVSYIPDAIPFCLMQKDCICHKENKFEEYFFIPRQEDLQEIYNKNKGITTDLVIYAFKEYYETEYNWADDFTMIWLCFVMEKVFNKQWNRKLERWETIK